jgi:hypothetical protein
MAHIGNVHFDVCDMFCILPQVVSGLQSN